MEGKDEESVRSPRLALFLAALSLACVAVGISSMIVPVQMMFLAHECDKQGLDPDSSACRKCDDCVHVANENTSWLNMATNVPQLLSLGAVSHLSDCHSRKLAFQLGAGGACAFYCMLAFVSLRHFTTIILPCAVVANLTSGSTSTLANCFAVVADVTARYDPTRQRQLFGMVEAAFWLGFLAGPSLGGVLSSAVGPQRSLLLASGAYLLGFLVFSATPQTMSKRATFHLHDLNSFAPLWMLLRLNSIALRLIAITACSFMAVTGIIVMLPMFLTRHYDFDNEANGLVQTEIFLGNAIGLLVVLPLMLHWNVAPRVVLFVSTASIVVFGGCIAAGVNVWAACVLPCLTAMYFPINRAVITSMVDGRRVGQALGAIACIQSATQMVSGVVAPRLLNALHWRLAFLVFTIIGSLSVVVVLTLPSLRSLPKAEEVQPLADPMTEPITERV